MSEERRVTKIDYNGSRVETGSLQIGDDWPGVFIRGDAAAYYSMMIESFLENREDALAEFQVRDLARILGGVVADTYNDTQIDRNKT